MVKVDIVFETESDLLDALKAVMPELPAAGRAIVDSSIEQGDDCMAVADILQFALIARVKIPATTLQAAKDVVQADWDPELEERTLGWLDTHLMLLA